MLLVDFSPLVIASYMAIAFGSDNRSEVDLELVRHVSLDGIRLINSKFRRRYGQPVFAIDSKGGSWRRDVFPYYKANRSKTRKESDIDWAELLRCINTVALELKESFPYKVIEVPKSEADDIIGVLTKKAVASGEEVMIISGDKDFIQLQAGNQLVQQWDKRTESYIGADDPKRYLFEHVLKGDSGDGVPNILSPGDCFVTKTRQKPMTQKRLDEFWEDKQKLKEIPRFMENLKLIDLSFTPKDIQQNIISMYDDYVVNDRNQLPNYFIAKRMKKLYQSISDF